ncbi:hypothetical protein B0H14DRAFT_3481252 [Mycena olivaceomarginata]|nr:hypothetical protein B0H14DRAFT_3481252 [Mycena olivaceomarginata]
MAVLPTSLFLVALAGFCAAQTITSTSLGTLYGIAYPSDIFNSIGDVWFDSQPEVSILGTGSGGQTTFLLPRHCHGQFGTGCATQGFWYRTVGESTSPRSCTRGWSLLFPAVVQTAVNTEQQPTAGAPLFLALHADLVLPFAANLVVAVATNLTFALSNTRTQSTPSGAIVGGVIGGIAVVVAVLGIPPAKTQGERRQRLKQMQDTVQQLQRNLSVSNSDSPATSTAVESESEVVAMRRQMDMLLGR